MENEENISAIKGFDRDLKCRGMQFEVGGTYTHDGDVVRCGDGGFHSVDGNPLDAWTYYSPAISRYAIVQASGDIARGGPDDDSKIASASLHVEAEILLPALIKRAAEWVINRAKANAATGDRGHAAATGDSGHAAATGYRGHAATTGYRGHAAATGNWGHAAATGDWGHAAATGDWGHAAATGDSGHAAATGGWGVAVSVGVGGTATAGETGAIVLARWARVGDEWRRTHIAAFEVGTHGVEAGKVYRLNADGRPEEVKA